MRPSGLAIAALIIVALTACVAAAPKSGAATPTPPPLPGDVTRDDMEASINAAQGDPENFAGVWWDPNGWPLHVMIATDDPEMRAKVQEWIPAGAQVAFHRVPHSYAQLDAIQNEIVDVWSDDLQGRGVLSISSVSVDVVNNRVVVGVTDHLADFEAPLRARHGNAVEFRLEEPSQPLLP